MLYLPAMERRRLVQLNFTLWNLSGMVKVWLIILCYNCCYIKLQFIILQHIFSKFAEIFEFDAMEDPPSVMKINVYDFDGPFDEVESLGHAEVNFLKSNLSELSDIWIPLKGKLAQACQSKLHLRIILNNSRGTEVMKDYLDKMEKEVGKKVMHLSSLFLSEVKCHPILACLFSYANLPCRLL